MNEKEKKDALRNQLFAKYFESDEGVLLTDFLEKLAFIADAWQKLRELCSKHIKLFDPIFGELEKIKMIEQKGKKYLIIQSFYEEYIILDIEKNMSINQSEFQEYFDAAFFIEHFDEKIEDETAFMEDCYLYEVKDDAKEIIEFYLRNQVVFDLNNQVFYRYKIGKALTYFRINFTNKDVQMGFQTPNQFLYEFMHLNYNLTPFEMQNACNSIGIERMQEMFAQIKEMKIPKKVIPKDLLQQYKKQKENEKKDELRNQLFAKYFESDEGILATDLVEKLAFIPKIYQELREFCKKNIRYFDSTSNIEKMRLVTRKKKQYLIMKLNMLKYVIIDIEKFENINVNQFSKLFSINFLMTYFDEPKSARKYQNLLRIEEYKGDKKELLDFYLQNQNVFQLSNSICYHYKIGEAWTYFDIDFADHSARMGFQTPNQFLYEQLNLHYDLTPSRMQDAGGRIGVERMQEMFQEIPKIKIPEECIPEDLLEEYKKQKENVKRDLRIKNE